MRKRNYSEDICLIKILPEESQPKECAKCAGFAPHCKNFIAAGFETKNK